MDEKRKTRFTINVRGYVVDMDYTPDYFAGRDHFAFLSPHEPRRPHPVSETGYRSHFAAKADVASLGGPEPFAAWYAEQVAAEKDPKPRTRKERPKRRPLPERPADGGHAARVAEERRDDDRPLTQGDLF